MIHHLLFFIIADGIRRNVSQFASSPIRYISTPHLFLQQLIRVFTAQKVSIQSSLRNFSSSSATAASSDNPDRPDAYEP
jgi:hypothetical protein